MPSPVALAFRYAEFSLSLRKSFERVKPDDIGSVHLVDAYMYWFSRSMAVYYSVMSHTGGTGGEPPSIALSLTTARLVEQTTPYKTKAQLQCKPSFIKSNLAEG